MLNKTFLIKETNIFFLYLRNENEKFHRRIDMKQKRDLADVHRCCPYGNRRTTERKTYIAAQKRVV